MLQLQRVQRRAEQRLAHIDGIRFAQRSPASGQHLQGMTAFDHIDAGMPTASGYIAILGNVDFVGGLIVFDHLEECRGRYVVQVACGQIDQLVLKLKNEKRAL